MSRLQIRDEDIPSLHGKVAVITGMLIFFLILFAVLPVQLETRAKSKLVESPVTNPSGGGFDQAPRPASAMRRPRS